MNNFEEKLQHLIAEALQEDLGDGDHSSLACIPEGQEGTAILKIKQEGVLAGIAVAEKIFRQVNPASVFTPYKQDGDLIKPGETAFRVTTDVRTLLSCERLVLNCMQRMSGIATLTRQYAEKIKPYHARLLDTRKTTPNFRLLEKEAVRIGGGLNHRFGLYDMIMLKDNHIDFAGGLEAAIDKAFRYSQQRTPPLRIEVETRNLADVRTVCKAGKGKIFRILLDNFLPGEIAEALKITGADFETEASGGITLDNIEAYAKTGVDYISVGGLIHQAKSIDLSLKAEIGSL